MTCLLVFPWIYNRQEECGWKNIHGRPPIGQFINTHASLNDFPATKLDSLLLSIAISPEIHLIQQSSYRHFWMYWSQCSCPCTLTFRKFFFAGLQFCTNRIGFGQKTAWMYNLCIFIFIYKLLPALIFVCNICWYISKNAVLFIYLPTYVHRIHIKKNIEWNSTGGSDRRRPTSISNELRYMWVLTFPFNKISITRREFPLGPSRPLW